ncbi:MAG: PAS domain S-box protein [Promethearchaeota archaeon]
MVESELYQTEKIFKEFIENISSGVVIYETTNNGKTFIIKGINKVGLESFQVSREEIIGKNIIEVFPTITEFGLVDLLRKVWKTGKPEHSPTFLYQDDRVSGWTKMYIYKLPSGKLVTIFEQKTKLIEAEANFKKKVEFEKVISAISSQFVNLKSIDDTIITSLSKIGHLSQSSRSYLFIFDEENNTMSNTHEWCAEGVNPQIENLQNTPIEVFPWSISKLKNDEILNIDDVENLPPEASAEKEEFMRENIKSLIFLPLKIGEKISGFIGFDNVTISKKWSEDDLNLLKITSDIIGNALKRIKTEQELEKLNKELEQKVRKSSKKLEESEEKYRKLFENSPIAIMEQDYSETKNYIDYLKSSGVTDFKKFFDENPKEVIKLITMNKVVDVNRKTLEIYNANNKEDFISKANHISDSIERNITDEVLSYNKNEFLSLMEGKTVYESEIASKTFTKDTIYLYARTSILPGFENTWSKIVVTLMDITERKITEEKLRESEEKFKTLADQSLMGIFIIQDGKTVYANQKIADMFGYSFEQVMSMTLEEQLRQIDPEDRMFVKEQAIKKQKGEKDVVNQYQFRYFRESGELMWIEVYSKTILYGGKPANFVTFVDITDQKRIEEALQESESEKSTILESLLEHIVYQTTDNTIIYANKAAADSVNLTPDQLVGHKCYQVWNDRKEPCEGCPIVKAIKADKPVATEMTTPDGRIWYVAGYPVRDKENNIIGVVESTLNITEKKTAEEKIKKSEEKYRKAYFQANLYRDIFAHDINNILQNISSSVELSALYLNNPEKLNTIKELFDIVDEQVNRAKKLILNVRKITELDESEVNLEKIDANRVLNNAIDFLKSSFQTRNINVQLNSPLKKNYINANNLLLDVFENLLINAVRHNNKSKIDIIIDIKKEKKDDKNFLKMEFKDNGVGISDNRKKSIFERGSRKSQKTKGMGLGLSLVKKIIDIYQGDIWVEDRVKNDYKQGSNFIVLIPTNS